jgi:hypothetical protein
MRFGPKEKAIIEYLQKAKKPVSIRELTDKFSLPESGAKGERGYLQKSITISILDKLDIKGAVLFQDRNQPTCKVYLSEKGKAINPHGLQYT